MRPLSLFLALAAWAHAQPPAPLAEAIRTSRAQTEHWAYTETEEMSDEKGRSPGDTVVRYDPSLPYADQYQPIRVRGHAPSAKDREWYREQGEKQGRELAGRAAREADGKPEPARIDIGFGRAVIDFDRARLVREDAGTLTYLVPLRGEDLHSPPFSKLEWTFSVAKRTHTFAEAHLRLLSPMRLKVVLRLNQGDLRQVWTQVDPHFPPVVTHRDGWLAASLLFYHFTGWEKMQRSDFRRVRPYSDRFGVKIGPLRALSF